MPPLRCMARLENGGLPGTIVLTLAALLGLTGNPCVVRAADPAAPLDVPGIEFFESKVRPILAAHCLSCHGPRKQKAGLRLDSREALMKGGESGPAITSGDPVVSLLIEAVGYDGETQMPPKGKLDPREIETLTEWVKRGAPWPHGPSSAVDSSKPKPADPSDHWAFRPVVNPAVPLVKNADWPRGAIDGFVLSRLEARGLRPVEPADRRSLIRRASFDLTGLPPSIAEIDAFLADSSPDAFDRVVDRLLTSPRYGERWGRHWLDVARYAEDQAHTFEARLYPHGFRYRDWVVNALNADMPYDRFVTEQIAGDLVGGVESGRESRLAALGFFALGPVYYGNAIADERDDRIDTLSRGFLALTVSCARCHDHKYDPIPTRDYYALAGVFASTRYHEYPLAPKDVVEAFDQSQAAIKTKTKALEVERKKSVGDRDKIKALSTALDRLKKDAPAPYPVVHSLAETAKPVNLRVAIRGNPETLGEETTRHFLSVLSHGSAPAFEQGSGRLELARAITDRNNPLTARVIVNRIWEHHFGRGLVTTPSNFGALGAPPTHPELLDYLASRLVAVGWSMKVIHREILLSATYQLSSRIDPTNQQVDPENSWLWRMSPRRLEVEAWRDAMLDVSGELDATLGGPSQDLTAPGNRRRTLYGKVSRHNLDPLLRLFDFPDPNLTCDRRVVTAVPLQQLFVLNSRFMTRQARALAKRLTSNPGEPDPSRIRRAFPLLFGREATDDEVRMGKDFLAISGVPERERSNDPLSPWEQYAQVLLGSNEFAFVD